MYVYRFLNKKGEVIYVGRSVDLGRRLNTHSHLPVECYNEKDKIEYIKLGSINEMHIYEIYYISKYKPKYNVEYNNGSDIGFELPLLDWVDIKDYKRIDEDIRKPINSEVFMINRRSIPTSRRDKFLLPRFTCNPLQLSTSNDLKSINNTHISLLEFFISRIINKSTVEKSTNTNNSCDYFIVPLKEVRYIVPNNYIYKYIYSLTNIKVDDRVIIEDIIIDSSIKVIYFKLNDYILEELLNKDESCVALDCSIIDDLFTSYEEVLLYKIIMSNIDNYIELDYIKSTIPNINILSCVKSLNDMHDLNISYELNDNYIKFTP